MVCQICKANFTNLEDLKAHVVVHTRSCVVYQCKKCGNVFPTSAARKRHKLAHCISADWTCELCNRKFTQHSFYLDHILMHKLKKEMKVLVCSCCELNFETENDLIEHEKLHSEMKKVVVVNENDEEEEEKIEIVKSSKQGASEDVEMFLMPVEDKEDNCNGVKEGGEEEEEDLSNSNKDSYTIIQVVQEEDNGEYLCGECGKPWPDVESITEHMKEHMEPTLYNGTDCKQNFEHIPDFDSGARPYSCNVCSAAFSSKNGLRNHRLTHSSVKFPCEECGNEFKGRSGLYLHKQRVHKGKRDFTCEFCGKAFALKCQRDTHRRVHTGEKPFKCELCGAGFKAQSGLYAHRKTHTDERPYKCEICGKRLRLPYNLRLHMRTHTGEKPYECDICGRAFSQQGDCKKHRKTHSKKEERNAADNLRKIEKPDFIDITYLFDA